MDPNILKEAMAAYQAVYSQEDVEQLDERRLSGPEARKVDAERRMQANVARAQAPTPPTPRSPQDARRPGTARRYQAVAADKGRGGDAAYRAGGGDAAARSGLTRQQIQQKGMTATRAGAAKPAATAPAAKPAAKPAATGGAKPAATKPAAPVAKPAATPSAKVEPAKPAPRQKDTSITDMIGRSQIRQGAPINTGNKSSDIRSMAARGTDVGGSGSSTPKPAAPVNRATGSKKPGSIVSSFDMLSSSNVKGMIEAYADVYTPQELDEVSLKTKMSAFKKRATHDFESDGDSDNYTKSGENKTDKIKANIVKKHGEKAGQHAERAAHTGIFGRKSFSMPKKPEKTRKEDLDIFDVVLEFLQAEGFAETLEEAEWMMANVIDEEAIDIILGEGVPLRGITPDGKPWRVDPSPSGDRQPAKMERNPKERKSPKGSDYKSKLKKSDRYEEVEYVDEAQHARENPEKYEREQGRKYEPVRGEKTPMPPRGDKRREDFEKWYAKQMGR